MQNDFLILTSHIGCNEFKSLSDDYYTSNGYEIKKFEYLLIKTKLEKYTYEIAELCWYAKQNQHLGLPDEKLYREARQSTYEYMKKHSEMTKALQLLLENHKSLEIEISSSSDKVKFNYALPNVIEILINNLDCGFTHDWDNTSDKIDKIEFLNNLSTYFNRHTPRRGAPTKNQYIATLAEIIICIINFEEYMDNVRQNEKLKDEIYKEVDAKEKDGYSGQFREYQFDKLNKIDDARKKVKLNYVDCILTHDILCFWNLIEDVRDQKIFKITPYDFIRQLIKNIRKQRPNTNSINSIMSQNSDNYLI